MKEKIEAIINQYKTNINALEINDFSSVENGIKISRKKKVTEDINVLKK